MIKAIGAVLVISGGIWWGAQGVLRMKSKIRCISELITSLQLLENEICDRRAALPEALATVINSVDGAVRKFYVNLQEGLSELGTKTFGEIWRKSLRDSGDMGLDDAERQAVARLGHNLGKYDTEFQKSAIEGVLRELGTFYEKAKHEYQRDWKVQAFVGMAASTLAVIVLL